MKFVKLASSSQGGYFCKNASNIGMTILGRFLSSDVGSGPSGFKEWGTNNNLGEACSGNLTALEKEDNFILLSDLYSDEEVPTELKMTRDQFVKLLDDWEEKVCRDKPKEVIIKYDNDEFTIETKN